MDLSKKCCDTCSEQREENQKLSLINRQKEEETMKLLFDLSLAKAELEKERQLRIQIEKQLTETNLITEQVSMHDVNDQIDRLVRLVGDVEEKSGEK